MPQSNNATNDQPTNNHNNKDIGLRSPFEDDKDAKNDFHAHNNTSNSDKRGANMAGQSEWRVYKPRNNSAQHGRSGHNSTSHKQNRNQQRGRGNEHQGNVGNRSPHHSYHSHRQDRAAGMKYPRSQDNSINYMEHSQRSTSRNSTGSSKQQHSTSAHHHNSGNSNKSPHHSYRKKHRRQNNTPHHTPNHKAQSHVSRTSNNDTDSAPKNTENLHCGLCGQALPSSAAEIGILGTAQNEASAGDIDAASVPTESSVNDRVDSIEPLPPPQQRVDTTLTEQKDDTKGSNGSGGTPVTEAEVQTSQVPQVTPPELSPISSADELLTPQNGPNTANAPTTTTSTSTQTVENPLANVGGDATASHHDPSVIVDIPEDMPVTTFASTETSEVASTSPSQLPPLCPTAASADSPKGSDEMESTATVTTQPVRPRDYTLHPFVRWTDGERLEMIPITALLEGGPIITPDHFPRPQNNKKEYVAERDTPCIGMQPMDQKHLTLNGMIDDFKKEYHKNHSNAEDDDDNEVAKPPPPLSLLNDACGPDTTSGSSCDNDDGDEHYFSSSDSDGIVIRKKKRNVTAKQKKQQKQPTEKEHQHIAPQHLRGRHFPVQGIATPKTLVALRVPTRPPPQLVSAALISRDLLNSYDSESDSFNWHATEEGVQRFAQRILWLCDEATKLWKPQPLLREAIAPAYVIGDIHGNFKDLRFFLNLLLVMGDISLTPCQLICLGDYVDRGPHSLECTILLIALSVQCPSKVVLLRGNHEDRIVCGDRLVYGEEAFLGQCCSVMGTALGTMIFRKVTRLFCYMPLACEIVSPMGGARAFCSHGGFPRFMHGDPYSEGVDKLALLRRPDFPRFLTMFPNNPAAADDSGSDAGEDPYADPGESDHDADFSDNDDATEMLTERQKTMRAVQRNTQRLKGAELYETAWFSAFDLIWSDPTTDEDERGMLDDHGFACNGRGMNVLSFSAQAVDAFLDAYGYTMLFRAHQEKQFGLRLSKNSKCLTLFSTSNYLGHGNGAGCAIVSSEGEVRLVMRSDTCPASEAVTRMGSAPDHFPSSANRQDTMSWTTSNMSTHSSHDAAVAAAGNQGGAQQYDDDEYDFDDDDDFDDDELGVFGTRRRATNATAAAPPPVGTPSGAAVKSHVSLLN